MSGLVDAGGGAAVVRAAEAARHLVLVQPGEVREGHVAVRAHVRSENKLFTLISSFII